jgi:hypothetical protein
MTLAMAAAPKLPEIFEALRRDWPSVVTTG